VFQLIANVLSWFYEITHSYAASIGLLTLSVMVLLTPLTLKGTKSMIQMQRLQPEIKRLQAQFKGDRQRMNEEMMRFYQENKINPLSGCLPLLIQAPVFAILYRVIHKLTAIGKDGTFSPSYISKNSELYKALDPSKTMKSFGIDLSQSTVKAMQQSFGHAIPFLVLVFLVGLTSWFQQRQIMARNTGQAVNPQQQMMMKFIPFIWPVILLTLPTGLAVYGLVSNLYRIAQQGYITRALYRPGLASGVIEAKAIDDEPKRPNRKSGPSSNGKSNGNGVAPKGPNPKAPKDSNTASVRPPKPQPSRVTPPKARPKPKPLPSGRTSRPPDGRKK
jgi:YidC/Oxa1 family membrane protein insertase